MSSMDRERIAPLSLTAEQTLHQWEERGKTSESCAVYGTHTRLLRHILQNEAIPSYPSSDLLYQQQIVRRGDHLYYMLPYVENMTGKSPAIDQAQLKILEQFPEHLSGRIPLNLSTDFIERVARFYAIEAAIEDAFFQMTGVRGSSTDINILARECVPDEFDRYAKYTSSYYAHTLTQLDEIDTETEKNAMRYFDLIDREQLVQVLPHVLDRRGVMIYFNKAIATEGIVLPGHESEQEIMIVSPKPLSIETIDGIQFLSEQDRLDFFPR